MVRNDAVVPKLVRGLADPQVVRFVDAALDVEIARLGFFDLSENWRNNDNPKKLRNYFLQKHDDAVGELAEILARDVTNNHQIAWLARKAGSVHDIGKAGLALHRKAGHLNTVEHFMKCWHAWIGWHRLRTRAAEVPCADARDILRIIAEVVKYHHHPYKSKDWLVQLVAYTVCCADSMVAAMEDRDEDPSLQRTPQEALAKLSVQLEQEEFQRFREMNEVVLHFFSQVHNIRSVRVVAESDMVAVGGET